MELPYISRYSFNYFYLPLCKINNLYVYPFLLAIVSYLHVFVENKISVKMLPAWIFLLGKLWIFWGVGVLWTILSLPIWHSFFSFCLISTFYNSFSPGNDKLAMSPYNINALSTRKVLRRRKNITLEILFDWTQNSQSYNYENCIEYRESGMRSWVLVEIESEASARELSRSIWTTHPIVFNCVKYPVAPITFRRLNDFSP